MIRSILKRLIRRVAIRFGFKSQKGWSDYYNNAPDKIRYDSGSMVDALLLSATLYPDNIALEYYDKRITYLELISRIKACAKALKKQGIKENDRVAICMPNTPESIVAFYAINMVGAVANMIHPLSSENEIEFYLNKAHSKMIIVIDICYLKLMNIVRNTEVEKIVVASATKSMNFFIKIIYWIIKGRKIKIDRKSDSILTWSRFIYLGTEYNDDFYTKRNAQDLAVILYSGGTTGKPKGIMLSNLNFNAGALQGRYMSSAVNPESVILTILPNFHSFGLGVSIHTPLYNGMKLVVVPKFDIKAMAKIIKKYQPNIIVGVPSLYSALIKMKFGRYDLKCINVAICGGDTIALDLKRKVNNFLKEHGSKTDLRVGYGLTECTGACCLSPEGLENLKDVIGIPFPDNEIKIVEIGTCQEVANNTDGEICLSSPNVMLGYLDEKKETKDVIKKHEDGKLWLHTGDIGYIDIDGFLYFRSRLKRMFITSGYNIYPQYIEEILLNNKYVSAVAVVGIPHPYKGQVGKAYIVLKDNQVKVKLAKKSIQKHLKLNLADYAIPSEIVYVDCLPMTLVGKISYKDL